jgi:putative intracellular protease/amidase
VSTILFAVTAAASWELKDGSSLPSGFWAEELIDPYDILTAAGHRVIIATPGGAPAPLQAYSLDESMTGSAERSAALKARLDALAPQLELPVALADADIASLDAVYIPGGTGPMQDLSEDADLARILGALHARDAFITAACHGPAGLLSARTAEGTWLFAGYRVTGYSNEEESIGGPGDRAPFKLENQLLDQGGDYQSSGSAYSPFVVKDRNLITGQNPASSAEVARQLAHALER